ncbi:predicted protein [Streptomyces viridochromogenes DSM 40736]|uniref:Predicted protein n=1 Tax=Streptomyces viridochromogenes (strain DSM 40736 / JCM 4977 / BCRC 1201 / Tue 494) TaxID=591159 RepID=D9XGY9_STRVT|nr:hypothetical protein [Streptomyces viridochromogenes]EFL32782.1 predicted protein [Streptomyces viridochromogenes DSM 40736]
MADLKVTLYSGPDYTGPSKQLDYEDTHPDRVYSLKALGLPCVRSIKLPDPVPVDEGRPEAKEARLVRVFRYRPASVYVAEGQEDYKDIQESVPDLGEVWCKGPYFHVGYRSIGVWQPNWISDNDLTFLCTSSTDGPPAEVID